ncbi:MAG: ABC transporter permease [Deltaproteobacteria bacterium]|nr:ABC transporter permease [Deltaproteobacteria bacterium]
MIPLSYNVRSLAVRRTTTIAAALGIALVVFVLASALMLSAGIKHTLGSAGRADVAVVLRKGSDTEMMSSIEDPTVGLILAGPGVKKGEGGLPLGVGELVVVLAMDKVGGEGVSNVQARGVPDQVMKFRPEVRIVAGRPARPGTSEVIIGTRIRGRFKGIDLGQSFELRKNKPATVVGVFEDGGSSHESEVWADLNTLRQSFGRDGLVSAVHVRLESAAAFEGFEAYAEQDKRLGLIAMRQSAYYEKQSEGTSLFITVMGAVIAVFFSIGAMIGAMITMYASVADRQREIGTLRALGFSRLSVLSSFLVEGLLLSLVGGALGTLAAMTLRFVRFSMMNFASWSEIVFSLTPTPQILVTAGLAAAGMGLLGGFLPALRAARISPIQAMRG